jgi:hypothetical protein
LEVTSDLQAYQVFVGKPHPKRDMHNLQWMSEIIQKTNAIYLRCEVADGATETDHRTTTILFTFD